MISKKDFEDLRVGDVVEIPGLFPGLDREPLLLTITEVVTLDAKTTAAIAFDVTYFDAAIGHGAGQLIDGKVHIELEAA